MAVLCVAAPGWAQSRSVESNAQVRTEDSLEVQPTYVRPGSPESFRPYGAAEFGLGLLTLPGAEVCVDPIEGCEQGDTSLEVSAWQVFRISPDFGLGAGIMLALLPTTDAPRDDPPGIPRDHSRGYFTVESIARYYPIAGPRFESWLGLTGGLVVVSDSFKNQETESDRQLVGPRGATIRTEGITAGVAGGLAWGLGSRVYVGTRLRIAQWFLPNKPETDPLGDEASLTGRVTMFDLGATLEYRLPL